MRRAFEYLGWTVDCWQEREFISTARSFAGLELFAARARGEDLVLHTMTQGNYPPEIVLNFWRFCRDAGVPTASIHLDRFYGLSSPKDSGPQRCDLPRLHPMFRVDHVFTADGDSDELFARDGVNHHWLPPAVRFDEARDIEPTGEDRGTFDRYAVGFCGARGYHPEHDRAGLVDALAARYGDAFVRVAGDTALGTVRGEALNRMYATVPVWVGDSCFAGSSSRYFSDRFFETWGRGGFLVFPRLNALDDMVGDYPSWTPYEDRDAMFAAIDLWLGQPGAREMARVRIARLVRAEHTYVNRVAEMLDVIGLDYDRLKVVAPIVVRQENDGSFDRTGGDGWPEGPLVDEGRADRLRYEYRLLQKNGTVIHDDGQRGRLTDIEIAHAGARWLDWRWSALAPHRVERRVLHEDEWEPVE